MSTSRKALILASSVVSAAILSCLTADGVFRLVGVRTAQTTDGIYAPMPDSGYGHRAQTCVYMNWFPHGFSVCTDALGLRVPVGGLGASEHGAKLDILVLGDSQGFGNGVEQEQSIPGRLQQLASARGWTVGNVAVGGHGLQNQMQALQLLRDRHEIRCRVVVLLLTPAMMSNPSGFTRATVYQGNLYDRPPTRPMLARHWLSTHSAAYIVVRNAAARLTRDSGRATKAILQMYETGSTVSAREQALLSEAQALVQLAASMGARVVTAYLPLEIEGRITQFASTSALAQVSPMVLRGMARRVASAIGAPFVDTSPALDRVRASGAAVALEGDPHYSELTNDQCARMIWESVGWERLMGDRTVNEAERAKRDDHR